MPTVNASAGASDANSYVTVAEADAYFAESFGRTLWATREPSDKEILVIQASRSLDMYMTWSGFKSSPSQSMEWPRSNAYDKIGLLYDSATIPAPIKFATMELAYHILSNAGLNFQEQSVDKVKVGPIDIQFADRSVDPGIPGFIEQLVSHIGSPIVVGGGKRAYTVRLERT